MRQRLKSSTKMLVRVTKAGVDGFFEGFSTGFYEDEFSPTSVSKEVSRFIHEPVLNEINEVSSLAGKVLRTIADVTTLLAIAGSDGVAAPIVIPLARGAIATSTAMAARGLFAADVDSVVLRSTGNPIHEALELAKPTLGKSNQLETILEDGTKVIFRRDVGENAHSIGKTYPQPTDHYNVEVHVPDPVKTGRYNSIQNMHVIVDKNMNVSDILLSNQSTTEKPVLSF